MRLGLSLIIYTAMATNLPAVAGGDIDAPPPPSAQVADDAQFVAYAQPKILFVGAKVIDGTGALPRIADVLIQDGKIVSVTSAGGMGAPIKGDAATIVDMRGRTLLPGFVMVHEHMFYPTGKSNYGNFAHSFPRLYLAGGTTTARTGGAMSPYSDLTLKKAIDQGTALGPDLDVSGPYLNGPGLSIMQVPALKDAADAARTVNYWADTGVTSFKAYTNITRDQLKSAIEAAHARGLKVTGHLCSVTYREAADLGIDNLEHGFATMTDFDPAKQPDECPPQSQQALESLDPNSAGVRSLMQALIAKRVAITSTLTIFETFTPGRPKAPGAALSLLIPDLRTAYEKRFSEVPSDPKNKPFTAILPKLMKLEKMYADMGGTLLAGTDPTGYGGIVPGYSAKREVELLVEAGFTVQQAIRIATLDGARYLGRDKTVGSIEPGKRADLVVIDGDPTKDVRALERMPYVFKAGVGYDTSKIFEAMKGQVGLY